MKLPLSLALCTCLILLLSWSSPCEGRPSVLRSQFVGKEGAELERVAAQVLQRAEGSGLRRHGQRFKRSLLIWPGTKWCGKGNEATLDDDLGEKREEDMCCRSHDKCTPKAFNARETRDGITNPMWLLSMSHCDCDDELIDCLRAVDSGTDGLLRIFFAVFITKCYRLDPPRVLDTRCR